MPRCVLVGIAALLLSARAAAADLRLSLPESVPPGVPVQVRLVWDGSDTLSDLGLPSAAGLTLRLAGEPERVELSGRILLVYPLTLTVAAVGDVRLGAVTAVRADGTAVSSAPLVLHCRTADARLVGDAWASAEFVPHTALPGQPVQLVYRLYLRRGVEAFSAGLRPPEDAHLENDHVGQLIDTVIDAQGRPWTEHTLSWALSFATSGERTAGGYQEVALDGDRSRVPIAAARILVAALPPGTPEDFSGVVGALAISSSCVPERIDADGGAVLAIAVRGVDAVLAPPPALALPNGVRAYAQPVEDGDQVRTYRWDLIAERPGDYDIRIGALCYLDPARGAYARTDAQQVRLAVGPARTRAAPAAIGESQLEDPTPTPSGGIASDPLQELNWSGAAGIIAVALTCLLVWAQSASARRRRGAARRALGRAMAAGDAEDAMRALRQIRPQLAEPQLPLAARLEALLDLARFGGAPPSQEARDLAHELAHGLDQEPAA